MAQQIEPFLFTKSHSASPLKIAPFGPGFHSYFLSVKDPILRCKKRFGYKYKSIVTKQQL